MESRDGRRQKQKAPKSKNKSNAFALEIHLTFALPSPPLDSH